MVDIAALLKSLPISMLEPNRVASIGGFIEVPKDQEWRVRITLLEPPAGQRVPYIEPVEALEILLRAQGVAPKDAKARALETVDRMKEEVAEDHWVNFFDSLEPESPDCLPLPDFVAWLRDERHRVNRLAFDLNLDWQGFKELASEEMLAPSDILDFFEQAAEVTACTPMFRGPDNRNEPWSLETLPALPPPKAMIEFVPGAPWADFEDEDGWEEAADNPFLRWREAMRPVALELEKALGEPVYYFKELGDELDDDDVHRFLVLHWCCTHKPESAFVRFLLKISGAKDVEELKAALVDPASYTHPFKMNDSFIGMETWPSCHFDYLPPGRQKTVVVLFSTPEARDAAQLLLAQKIGVRASIIAPRELATDAWIKQATRYCHDYWSVHYQYDEMLEKPIEILARADEVCVIANEQTPGKGSDLKLSEGAEDLLWLALELGMDAKHFHIDSIQLMSPETSLEARGAPARVAARKAQRAAFTRQLKEIRLNNDYCSSGLWDENGRMLGYDLLDLPFPLVRRIAALQCDFDDTVMPSGEKGSDEWRERHAQERIDIAWALRVALDSRIFVRIYHREGWMRIEEVTPALTEEEAVFAFAKAWNRLEPDGFLELLAPDARYASQWVFEELVGNHAIADYLRGKMQTVRACGIDNPDSRVRVEIGRTAHGAGSRPCAFMTQGESDVVKAVVLFEVSGNKIARYDLCIPQLLGAVRTGVYPI